MSQTTQGVLQDRLTHEEQRRAIAIAISAATGATTFLFDYAVRIEHYIATGETTTPAMRASFEKAKTA